MFLLGLLIGLIFGFVVGGINAKTKFFYVGKRRPTTQEIILGGRK